MCQSNQLKLICHTSSMNPRREHHCYFSIFFLKLLVILLIVGVSSPTTQTPSYLLSFKLPRAISIGIEESYMIDPRIFSLGLKIFSIADEICCLWLMECVGSSISFVEDLLAAQFFYDFFEWSI